MRYEDYPLYNHFWTQAHDDDDQMWQEICRQKLSRIEHTVDRINECLVRLQTWGLVITPHSLRIDYQSVAQVLDTSFSLLTERLARYDHKTLLSWLRKWIVKGSNIVHDDLKKLATRIRAHQTVRVGILTAHPERPVHDIDIILSD